MSIEAHEYSMGSDQFLGTTGLSGYSIFEIPMYQREYTWTKEEWEAFIKDLEESNDLNREHFFGSFVFIKNKKKSNTFDVVDGQQRLTTLSLFYLSLYKICTDLFNKMYKTCSPLDIQDYSEWLGDIKNQIYYSLSSNKKETRCKLLLSDCSDNNSIYRQLCKSVADYVYLTSGNNTKDTDFEWEIPCRKSSRIVKAFEYFTEYLSNIVKQYSSDSAAFEKICSYFDTIASDWSGIRILAPDELEATNLFDTLNNRGVALSPTDIIKNKLFAKLLHRETRDDLTYDQKDKLDEYNDKWVKLTKNLQTPTFLKRFFVDYYNLTHIDANKPINEGDIISKYTELFEKEEDIDNLYEDILQRADTYQAIILPETAIDKELKSIGSGKRKEGETKPIYYSALCCLNGVSAIPSFLFLLYLYEELGLKKNIETKKDNYFNETLAFITRFFTIRHITQQPPVKVLPELFFKWTQECKTNGLPKTAVALCKEFSLFINKKEKDGKTYKYRLSSISSLKASLQNLTYEGQKTRLAIIRYLFTLYEEKQYKYDCKNNKKVNPIRQNPMEVFWDKMGSDTYEYTIEHIVPQSKNLAKRSKAWVDVLGDDINKRSEFIHCLGNLLLVKYNSNLSDQSFEKKKELVYDSQGIFKMYEDVFDKYNTWQRSSVNARTDYLVNLLSEYLSEILISKE